MFLAKTRRTQRLMGEGLAWRAEGWEGFHTEARRHGGGIGHMGLIGRRGLRGGEREDEIAKAEFWAKTNGPARLSPSLQGTARLWLGVGIADKRARFSDARASGFGHEVWGDGRCGEVFCADLRGVARDFAKLYPARQENCVGETRCLRLSRKFA